MSDLISRQAAIDALGDEPEVWSGNDEYAQGLNNQWHYDVNALKAVPSAQPEQRWIPVTERLPKNRVYVLVTYRYEYGLIDHGITWYGVAEKKWNTSREVIAWKPLPEPWKGEQPC